MSESPPAGTETAQFRTISGRWKQHVAATGIDHSLSRRQQSLAMLMFYAGFSAGLDAVIEMSEFPENEAMHLMQSLQGEITQVEAIANQMVTGVRPS